jgi:serine/threonine protein kinase
MDASSDDATRGRGFAADVRSPRADRTGRTSASRTVIDGRYLVLRRIGSGATSAVYCAELLGRNVALKVLHGYFADDDEFVERFRERCSHSDRCSRHMSSANPDTYAGRSSLDL